MYGPHQRRHYEQREVAVFVLDQFGAASVPQLATKDLVAVDAAAEAVLNPPSDASLFG